MNKTYHQHLMVKVCLMILMICSSLYTLAVNTSDTVPKFKVVSIDEGNIPETKPFLAQRINGVKEIIIVYPMNSSALDELICTDLYNYFQNSAFKSPIIMPHIIEQILHQVM